MRSEGNRGSQGPPLGLPAAKLRQGRWNRSLRKQTSNGEATDPQGKPGQARRNPERAKLRRSSLGVSFVGVVPVPGSAYTRRHLVASSAAWGPCPTAAVLIPELTSQALPANRRRSALLRSVGPLPHGGRAYTRPPCSFPATSCRLLRSVGPLPLGGRVYSRAAVFISGDVLSPPP